MALSTLLHNYFAYENMTLKPLLANTLTCNCITVSKNNHKIFNWVRNDNIDPAEKWGVSLSLNPKLAGQYCLTVRKLNCHLYCKLLLPLGTLLIIPNLLWGHSHCLQLTFPLQWWRLISINPSFSFHTLISKSAWIQTQLACFAFPEGRLNLFTHLQCCPWCPPFLPPSTLFASAWFSNKDPRLSQLDSVT